jgi:5-methylcytosine-specific restriction endonuclease McrA
VLRAQPACAVCGTPGDANNPLSVDHIVPKAAGGSDDPRNLGPLCRRHNSAKGTR